jgi:hypothetical protein
MQSKKNIILNILFLLIATGIGVCVQAQRQKPSERSFSAEQNKINEYRAANNAKLRQMQQPSNDAAVPGGHSGQQQINLPASNTTSKPTISVNADSTKQNIQRPGNSVQQQRTTKPSEGTMKKPQRYSAHQL